MPALPPQPATRFVTIGSSAHASGSSASSPLADPSRLVPHRAQSPDAGTAATGANVGAAERLWRAAAKLLGAAAHRLFPHRLLPYRARGSRPAYGVHRGDRRVPRILQVAGQ